MRAPPLHRLALALLGLAGCQPTQGETGSFTTVQPTAPASTDDSSTGASSSTTGGGGATGSTSTSEVSTGTDSGATGASGTLLLDVGTDKDIGDPKPPGCKGKIDFLFVLSRDGSMKDAQAKLIAAFPKFIATIESKFADFDFHIMVIDGDHEWGLEPCDVDCEKQGSCEVPGYPCDLLDLVTACDRTIGAGSVFPTGGYATNKPCNIAGGRRYLTKEQPNLTETFACVAKLGISGRDLLGEAMTAAMQPAINAPGSCNAGFLRDDALLMVTFIGGYDYDSKGTPGTWAKSVLEAKKGDPGAVVMLSIVDSQCPYPHDRICMLAKKFPYYHLADVAYSDYALAFDKATDLVEVACAEYIPG